MINVSSSVHHLVPRSRLPQNLIQKLNPINTAIKNDHIHSPWHQVFANLTPFEAIIFYITIIAPNQFSYAEIIVNWEGIFSEGFLLSESNFYNFQKCKKKKFSKIAYYLSKDLVPIKIVETIVREWAPANYFYFIELVDSCDNRFNYYSPELRLAENSV